MDRTLRVELLGKAGEELRPLMVALGERAYRGAQIYHALYAERRFDFTTMSNLPAALRARLAAEASITQPRITKRYHSTDGSVRYLLALEGAPSSPAAATTSIETVYMPEATRQTICISTQAGCPVNCHFCLTAQLGLVRNLSAGEILGQVLVGLEDNRDKLAPQNNVVLMGQGQPLLNYSPGVAAAPLLSLPHGGGLSS